MEYIISIDFSSKLGYAIWEKGKNENKLLSFSNFIFQDKDFKKQFKNTTFQEKIYEKTIFLQNRSSTLINEIFSSFIWTKDDSFFVIVEFSDFGFKYTIENLSRIFAVFCLELNSYCKIKGIKNITLEKLIAVQWRSIFKKHNQQNYNWNKYEVNGKKTKKINWKVFALDWMNSYLNNNSIQPQSNNKFNDDIAEAILIGYTWINYIKNKSNF